MNIKSSGLFVVACALNLCAVALFTFSNTSQSVAAPKTKVAPKMSLYIQEKGKEDKLDRELITCDFGEVDYLDSKLFFEQADYYENLGAADEYLAGLKRYLYLVNNGDKNISILSSVHDSLSTDIYRVVGKQFIPMESQYGYSYTLKPQEKVELVIAFDYTLATPGKFEKTIELRDIYNNSLVNFQIRANLKSGIEFSTQHIDFGSIQSGSKSSLDFHLKLDHRLSDSTFAPIQLVTTSKYIRITCVPPNQKFKGIRIVNSKIEFNDPQGNPADKDLDLIFRAELLDNAPIGKINEQLKLSIVGSPNFLLLGNAKLHISGEVTGHMQSKPTGSINFGTLPNMKGARKLAIISCTTPLTLSSLRVASSNRFVTARMIIPAGDAENVAKLEMTLSPHAPVGKLVGKVTVTNTINKERIELLTGATVIK